MALKIYFARVYIYKKKKSTNYNTRLQACNFTNCTQAVPTSLHSLLTFCGMFGYWWLTTTTFNFLFLVLQSTLEYLMNPEQPLNSRSRMDLEAKGGITYDLGKKTKQSLYWFWKHVLKLSALSIFKIQVLYIHGFKSGIWHWILEVSFLLESKTSTSSKYFLFFKLFSCHPEAATPYLAAKHWELSQQYRFSTFTITVTELSLEWFSFMCYTGGQQQCIKP